MTKLQHHRLEHDMTEKTGEMVVTVVRDAWRLKHQAAERL